MSNTRNISEERCAIPLPHGKKQNNNRDERFK